MSLDLGALPQTLQGTCPLTHFGLCPSPSSPEGRKRAQLPLFCKNRMIREPYVKELSRHILVLNANKVGNALRYSTVSLTTVPLLLSRNLILHI